MSAFILQCAKCRWFHAYRVNLKKKKPSNGGVIRIDTVCSVCGARLKHTERPQGWRWMMKTVAPAHAVGSGGHNQQVSVLRCMKIPRSQVYVETRKLNQNRQRRIAEREGSTFFEEE